MIHTKTGWWPEYTLLSKQQAAATAVMAAAETAREASNYAKSASIATATLAAAQTNITESMRHSSSIHSSSKVKTRVEALLLDMSSHEHAMVINSMESLSLLRATEAESLRMHIKGRATNRIEMDQWMELGEKQPQKALGYVQKTITQALSHSLTTELSQVITSELTQSLSDMVSGLLSDTLASTGIYLYFFGINFCDAIYF